MPAIGHPRPIPTLDCLPRPLYARAERLVAGSWTTSHQHDWVQFSYAISGVLGVYTQAGSYFAPPQWGVWIPAQAEHAVSSSMQAEMRSLYIRRDACPWAAERCRVLEVTPLARELIKQFCLYPAHYPEEVAFSLPLPQHPGLLALCNGLIAAPEQPQTLQQWARELGCSEKTLMRLFQRETGLSFRNWRQRMRLLSSLTALEAGDTVTDAALGCGYDSTSAYIAAFKQLFGATPGELKL